MSEDEMTATDHHIAETSRDAQVMHQYKITTQRHTFHTYTLPLQINATQWHAPN
jgi:hypothetical protein